MASAYQKGLITDAGWARYKEGRALFLTHHLSLAKKNNMNHCKNCEMTFFVTANEEGDCAVGKNAAHVAKYDFTKSDNVLECEI